MKAKFVSYEELVSGPGYSNKKLGIIVEVEEGERADEAFKKAEKWVRDRLGISDELPF